MSQNEKYKIHLKILGRVFVKIKKQIYIGCRYIFINTFFQKGFDDFT